MAAASSSSSWEALLPPTWKDVIAGWLAADVPKFDVGGFVVGDELQTASLLAKGSGVLAGTPFASAVFELLGCTHEWLRPEGAEITAAEAKARTPVCTVTGPTRNLLLAERTALNILSRASGVASETKRATDAARTAGWKGCVAGTRKTTPGFGLVEKYAIVVGGGDTHRMDLSHMVRLSELPSRGHNPCG